MQCFEPARAVVFFLVLTSTAVGAAGCGGDDASPALSPEDGALVSATWVGRYAPQEVQAELEAAAPGLGALSHALGGDAFSPFELGGEQVDSILDPLLRFFEAYLHYDIDVYRVVYDGAGYAGLTGLLVVPRDAQDPDRSFPMLAYQHPTQVLRGMSPSRFPEVIVDDELTIPLALFLGRAGYIAAVADYPGLGDNHDVHPYCTKSLGRVVTAMLRASRQHLADEGAARRWNGELYLMGYSEGGYATAVTAQEVQQRYANVYRLRCVAALDGPHSLSDTMRNLMLDADAAYSAPYFLPYVIDGYGAAYGGRIPLLRFENAIVNPTVTDPDTGRQEPFNPNLRARLGGDYSGGQISAFMRLVAPYDGPRSILTADFLQALQRTSGPVCEALEINDATHGWSPTNATRFTFFHNRNDDLVPYDNSLRAFEDWIALTNVNDQPFLEYVPGLGSIHAGSLIPAVIRGFLWIDTFAWPDRTHPSEGCTPFDDVLECVYG